MLLEGWCVGARAIPYDSLQKPVNTLEQERDPHQVWRKYMNEQLASSYQIFFEQFDLLVMLKAPSFDCVKQWRALQESKLAKKVQQLKQDNEKSHHNGAGDAQFRGLMDENALNEFMMHYERLTKYMLCNMPEQADVVMELTAEHNIQRVEYNNELPVGGV